MAQMRFDDRMAVITGAGRRPGRVHALLLARLEARAVLNDPGGAIGSEGGAPAPAQAVVDELRAAGGEVIARVFIAETPGVYRPAWSLDEVDAALPAILDAGKVKDFGLHGHSAHIGYSFEMARAGMVAA